MNESKVTPKFLALSEDEISVSPTVTVKFGSVTLENCEQIIMRNSVFESLIFDQHMFQTMNYCEHAMYFNYLIL